MAVGTELSLFNIVYYTRSMEFNYAIIFPKRKKMTHKKTLKIREERANYESRMCQSEHESIPVH